MSDDTTPPVPPSLGPATPTDSRRIPVPHVIVVVAGVMALLGDFLLRDIPWGFNIALWGAVFYWIALPLAIRKTTGAVPTAAWLLLLAAGTFLLTPALRAAGTLHFVAYLASALCLFYGVSIAHGFKWLSAGIFSFPVCGLYAIGIIAESGTRHPLEKSSGNAKKTDWSCVRVLIRGALLAMPFLAVFGFLFARADANFVRFFNLNISLELVVQHVVTLCFCGAFAWFVLAALSTRSDRKEPKLSPAETGHIQFGAGEVNLALGLITALFLVFVFLQVRYLFGGAEYMMATANLTAATYARQGFYEMVTAGTLALATVYFFDWLTRDETQGDRRLLHWIIRVLLVLVAVVLGSAAHRMLVYIGLYGLTEDRLMTLVFMGALAALLLWSEGTLMRNHRERFTGGAFVVMIAAAAVYILINPHALIAETNAQRAREGKYFDTGYATYLGADALPAYIELLPNLAYEKLHGRSKYPDNLTALNALISRHKERLEKQGWRSWSLGNHRAWQALQNVPATESDKTPDESI